MADALGLASNSPQVIGVEVGETVTDTGSGTSETIILAIAN